VLVSDNPRAGQAAIMVTVGTVFLMGVLGLVVDVGWSYYRKQVLQAAVDSAAIAAATAANSAGAITCNSGGIVCQAATTCPNASAGSNFYSACKYGSYNGVANANLSIAANTTSPMNGVTVNYWATATATERMPPTFLSVLGGGSATINATATAASITSANAQGCLYVLDPTAGMAFNMNGSNVTTGCSVYVNSNNTSNAVFGNGSSLAVGSASLNMVTGAGLFCNGCGAVPTPNRGSAVSDPLANLPAPTFSGCDQTNYSYNSSSGTTLSPGVYCGGISINGSGNIVFKSGNYILNGGGLKINGNEAVTGTNVFFYNTSSGYAYAPLLLNGSGSQTFTPPSSGPYQGILFYQDRSVCSSSTNTINGGSNFVYTGTVYLHCGLSGANYTAAKILYNGVESPSNYQGLVVDQIQFNGTANLYKDPTNGENIGIGLSTAPMFIQ
jgi:hypothetical protein